MASCSEPFVAGAAAGQGERNDGGQRPGGHRGQVAEIRRQRLPADPPRIVACRAEIDAVGQHVGRDDDVRLDRRAK